MNRDKLKSYLPILVLVLMVAVGLWLSPGYIPRGTAPKTEPRGELSSLPAPETAVPKGQPAPAASTASPPTPSATSEATPPPSLDQLTQQVEKGGATATITDILLTLLKTALVLGGVCGLAWLSLKWVIPKLYGSRGKSTGQIQVMDTYRLDPRRNLLVVRVGAEYFLIAGSEAGIQFLARLKDGYPPPAAAETPGAEVEPKQSPFEKLLRKET